MSNRRRRRVRVSAPPVPGAVEQHLTVEALEPRTMLAGTVGPHVPVGPQVVAQAVPQIADPWAQHAVTYEQMVKRAATVDYRPGELIVALAESAAAETAPAHNWSELVGVPQTRVLRTILSTDRPGGTRVSLFQLSVGPHVEIMPILARLSTRPDVLWAAPNFQLTGSDPREYTPNDPQYASQWHHATMQNNLAWDLNEGSSVLIGITDDGTDLAHPDLNPNIYVNPGEVAGNGLDDDSNGYVDDVNGWDFISNNNNPNPNDSSNVHGTHVAGIAAARTNNNTGVAGTAGKARILPLQFYDATLGWTAAEIAAAYAYGADQGAKIISTSYNVDGWVGDPTYTAGLQYMYDQGVLHFNSAGNSAQLNPVRQAFEQSLLVASTDLGDIRSSFSNYGDGVDLAAPGGDIRSTLPGNSYGYQSGTSMATPNAAAVAALIWAQHPSWTREQVAGQLLGWATNIDALNPGYGGLLGSGRVNALAAVSADPANLAAPTVLGLQGLPTGTVGSTTPLSAFAIRYSQVMSAGSVTSTANYELRGSGNDQIFDTADDRLYALDCLTDYQVGTNWVHFSIQSGQLGIDNYRFRILSGGVENVFGTDLDGDQNGQSGGAFQRFFTVALNPFTTVGIPGSLASASLDNVGLLTTPGEIARVQLYAQAGEKLSLLVTPNTANVTLQARIGSGGAWVAAPGPGNSVLVPPTAIGASGNLELQVTGDEAGNYTFSVYRNLSVAGLNETPGPVSLDPVRIDLGSSSAAAWGTAEGSPGGLAFNHYVNAGLFVDISATGTPLNLSDDGEATITTTVGNAVFPAGQISIGNNGGVLGQPNQEVSYANTNLPNSSLGRALLPFWDDIDSDTGNVYWQQTTIGGINALVIQWKNRPHYSNLGNATFQIQVFQSGPVAVRYVYTDVDFGSAQFNNGASATIGVQVAPDEAYLFSLNSAVLSAGSVIDVTLASPTPDVDEYSLDLTGQTGAAIDVALAGVAQSFAGQTLELLDPNGNVVASGVGGAANYDLGIRGFQVTTGGLHTIRVSSFQPGEYALVATESLLFDTENNDVPADSRSLNSAAGALGWLAGNTLNFSQYSAPAKFINIAGTGTPLNLQDDGTVTVQTTVGNSLLPAGFVTIGNNGAVLSGFGVAIDTENTSLPNANWTQGLAPLWDDFDASAGNVYWQETVVDGIPTLIVQWDQRPRFSGIGNATFQLQLFAGGPTAVRFAYQDVDFGDSGFDGGADATIGVQVSPDEASVFSVNSPAVSNGDVIDFNFLERDVYSIQLTAGQRWSMETSTPFADPFRPGTNSLDPKLVVLDAVGNPLTSDSNSAPDGKNARVEFVATASGTYYVAVDRDGGEGSYVIHSQVSVPQVRIVAGNLTNVTGNWQTVNLSQTFQDPIVIVGPMGSNDQAPGVVRVRNVTGNSFQIRVDEWDYLDGSHLAETVSYLVLERGVNVLDNGKVLVADRVTANGSFSQQAFGTAFSGTPIVLATVASEQGPETVAPRLNNVTANGFEVRVQEQESLDGVHAHETVNYLALLPGLGSSNGLTYEAQAVAGVTHKAFPQRFLQNFLTPPRFLATMQSYNVADTATVRTRALTARAASLIIDEEQSLDAERAHAAETVGFLAFRYAPPAPASLGDSGAAAPLNQTTAPPAAPLLLSPVSVSLPTTAVEPVRVAALPTRTAVDASPDPRAATLAATAVTVDAFATSSASLQARPAATATAGWVRVDSSLTPSPGWYW